jgi:hypothetical protein
MQYDEKVAWVNSLKVGDEVYYKSGHYGDPEIFKVKKITPTQVVIDTRSMNSVRLWKKNGNVVGDGWRITIAPVTDAVREQIYRIDAKRKIDRVQWKEWSLERLQRLMAIINEDAATPSAEEVQADV